jgi:PhoH-like ATPase
MCVNRSFRVQTYNFEYILDCMNRKTSAAPDKKESTRKQKKIYVLDTSVILYDHDAINQFEENDIAIPIQVLEELDNFKKGNDHKNFEARQFVRLLDNKFGSKFLTNWVSLNGKTKGKFRIIMSSENAKIDSEKVFDSSKNDHKILNAALSLQASEKNKKVVLVSKDVALRLKALSLNLYAEDYKTGKVHDVANLYSGKRLIEKIPSETIDRIFENRAIPLADLKCEDIRSNQFLILRNGKKSILSRYNPITQFVERIEKRPVFGVKPRNAEQTFAIQAILDPDIKLVTIQGVAGTGKTLLALAGALEQRKQFQQIYITRPIVPLSNKDIGYLPGDIKSKLNPYMEPLWDNLKFIKTQFNQNDKHYKAIESMIETEKISITPLTYIRGRSISNVIFIVDEAQNLTPHEVKTIITRAGENTKIIFTGDVKQIDTPYLDSQSNGLTNLIEKLKGNVLFAHITLEKGERSELANIANDLL